MIPRMHCDGNGSCQAVSHLTRKFMPKAASRPSRLHMMYEVAQCECVHVLHLIQRSLSTHRYTQDHNPESIAVPKTLLALV